MGEKKIVQRETQNSIVRYNLSCHTFSSISAMIITRNPFFILFFFCSFQTLDGKVHFVYKKVAMVEQFFDIIYSVHVEAAGDTQLRGRAGKHCGQKRTYRAVSLKIE